MVAQERTSTCSQLRYGIFALERTRCGRIAGFASLATDGDGNTFGDLGLQEGPITFLWYGASLDSLLYCSQLGMCHLHTIEQASDGVSC